MNKEKGNAKSSAGNGEYWVGKESSSRRGWPGIERWTEKSAKGRGKRRHFVLLPEEDLLELEGSCIWQRRKPFSAAVQSG